jgi:ligand-binding SRPBCC domain-containing protein
MTAIVHRRLARGHHVLEVETFLPLPREKVVPFFADAENLERITPPELRFRIVTPTPLDMQEGLLIDYRMSLYGVPFRWKTRITIWDPPFRCTLMRDRVRYRLPFYPLGTLLPPLVRRQLTRIFRHRGQAVRAHLVPPHLREPVDAAARIQAAAASGGLGRRGTGEGSGTRSS